METAAQNGFYPCDTFDDWQDNLRAIALSMEKLRGVERYGVFKYGDIMDRLALASAEGKISETDAAFEFIAKQSGHQVIDISYNKSALKNAYRIAAQKLHPDTNGGETTEDFHKLQQARTVLAI